ncbi:hypothetical protein BH23ACT9_BH23ACT9_27170 [soil metagenome]
MPALTNRLQLLLDDARRERLERESARTGAPVSVLVRRAIDQAYPAEPVERDAAWDRLLAAEPVPVDDWQTMKQDLRDELSAPDA